MTGKIENMIDIGIITVREDEFSAVLRQIPKESELSHSRRYNIGNVEANGTQLSVAIMRCQEEGTGEAQSATRDMIEDLAPACVLVVGIAGGYPVDEFSLGDVVVSTRIHDFTVAAAREGKGLQFQVTGGRINKEIGSLVANFPAMEELFGDWYELRTVIDRPTIQVPVSYQKLYGQRHWKERVRSSLKLNFSNPRNRPIVYAGPIASSDSLVKDTLCAQAFLDAGSRKVIAIEMEMAGCYRACFDKDVPCLSVRGISDIVGLERETLWTKYACTSAASFAYALIRTGMLPRHSELRRGTAISIPPVPAIAKQNLTSERPVAQEVVETSVTTARVIKAPTDVFTPRNPNVNVSMYVDRPGLETSLWNAIRGSQHVLLHGESGTGKSWLYKRILAKNGVYSVVANLGNAARLNSIVDEIHRATFGTAPTVGPTDILELCLRELRLKAGSSLCCLVLDNLEYTRSSTLLMQELGEILVLLDDQRYAAYQVKFLLVGVPSDVRDYFAKTENKQTIANRLKEIPEVARLESGELDALVRRGFIVELDYQASEPDIEALIDHVAWLTTRIPQRVHEYCLELCFLCENARRIDISKLGEADQNWLQGSLSSSYTAIQALMNERETKVGRRNQVLYALGLVEKDDFRYGDIEEILREQFPVCTLKRKLNISGILSTLASETDPLIKRTAKGDSYEFSDPKWRMCLRATLRKEGERVARLDIGSIGKL